MPTPAGAPAANQPAPKPGVPLGQTQIIADINEPKLSGNALAGLYRTYTGRRVIVHRDQGRVWLVVLRTWDPEVAERPDHRPAGSQRQRPGERQHFQSTVN